jgi:hypothetical protein
MLHCFGYIILDFNLVCDRFQIDLFKFNSLGLGYSLVYMGALLKIHWLSEQHCKFARTLWKHRRQFIVLLDLH